MKTRSSTSACRKIKTPAVRLTTPPACRQRHGSRCQPDVRESRTCSHCTVQSQPPRAAWPCEKRVRRAAGRVWQPGVLLAPPQGIDRCQRQPRENLAVLVPPRAGRRARRGRRRRERRGAVCFGVNELKRSVVSGLAGRRARRGSRRRGQRGDATHPFRLHQLGVTGGLTRCCIWITMGAECVAAGRLISQDPAPTALSRAGIREARLWEPTV